MSLHDILRGDIMPQSGVDISIGRNTFDPPAPTVPVSDANARTLVLYDSGIMVGSGIVSFKSSNKHLLFKPAFSGVAPICTAVFIDAYNTSTSLGTTTTPTTVGVETTRAISSDKDFTIVSNEIIIWGSGTYEITLKLSTNQTVGNTRYSATGFLEHSSANGSFVEVPGSKVYTYVRQATNGEDTSLVTIILPNIAPGDLIRGRAHLLSTAAVVSQRTISGGCGITIMKLE